MNWQKYLKAKIRLREPLKKHTTFKIGGRVRFFIEPEDVNDLKLLLDLRKKNKLPLYVIGKGSNILASDKGIEAIVIKLSAPAFKKISCRKNYLEAGSGVLLNEVLLFSQRHGLSGAEFLAGIPGTLGGALAMNAGIAQKGKSIGDLAKEVAVMDYAGNIKTLQKKEIKFGYRESSLAEYIILSARLRLAKKNRARIKEKIKKYMSQRRITQDLAHPSAGCVFKNPQGHSAGRLIDLCALKGKRIGGAGVSLKHANFILNLGSAKARDVLKLMSLIKKKVKDKFHIALKPEIKIWQ